jgi:hypothetical protein
MWTQLRLRPWSHLVGVSLHNWFQFLLMIQIVITLSGCFTLSVNLMSFWVTIQWLLDVPQITFSRDWLAGSGKRASPVSSFYSLRKFQNLLAFFTMCIGDFVKLNLIWWFDKSQFSPLPKLHCLLNCGEKWPKNNHLTSFAKVQSESMKHSVYSFLW